MTGTRKDHRQWRKKERNRTGEVDPEKIALHRQRFLDRLEQKTLARSGYKTIIFRSALRFRPDDITTDILVEREVIAEVPFLVDDPSFCHYAISAYKPDFNATREEEILLKHVRKVHHLGQSCHLSVLTEGTKSCTSIAACPFRKWIAEQGRAACTLP